METISASPFRNLCQIGVIVKNIDEAAEFYQSLGIGPFVSPQHPAPIVDRMMHGRPAPDVKNRISTAQLGPIELELVQPISGESIQKEFLQTHGEGVNHLGFRVENIERGVAKLIEKGFRVVSSGKTIGSGRFAYVSTDKVGGILFELMQSDSVVTDP